MAQQEKVCYIIAGGTFVTVASHFSLAAEAFGTVGRELAMHLTGAFKAHGNPDWRYTVRLIMTKMAQGGWSRESWQPDFFSAAGIDDLRTNDDLAKLTAYIVSLPDTHSIVFAAAACDFKPSWLESGRSSTVDFGRKSIRLDSSAVYKMSLTATPKIISTIRRTRKDVFLVGFKETVGMTAEQQYLRGLRLLKQTSCNLVLANDIDERRNMVITPEQARYHETTDRQAALKGLAEIIALRSKLTFTKSTRADGDTVPWSSTEIPDTLRAVVDHCIKRGAYKPFLGVTVGHFASKGRDGSIITSRRKTNFNDLAAVGMVRIRQTGADSVIVYGKDASIKPSVGGQSQRIIFDEHPDMDCIVHFHCPLKSGSQVNVRSQREYECGSHECGRNTSAGLSPYDDGVLAVMLDQHGANVVFSRDADTAKVIAFIERNFDLSGRTDGVTE